MPREPLTLALVALCVGWTLLARWRQWGYDEAGALSRDHLWNGQYLRLFSAMFLHHLEGWLHLVANAISLFFVGRVIERACGRRVLLGWLVASAIAGFAGSLVLRPEPGAVLMGISGGIAGLIGLLIAVEWAVTKSLWDFLKQRNTILLAFFVALSVGLAVWAESQGMLVDHIGHAGGFLCGLLSGFVCFTRRGIRWARGIAVLLLLSVLPAAYASHPVLDPGYQLFRARRAYHAGDYETAVRRFERARELDSKAFDAEARGLLLRAYLRLAADAPDPLPLLEAAQALGGRDPNPWLAFAEGAEGRAAYVALRTAAALLPPSAAWKPLARALKLRGDAPPLETLALARGAAAGLRAPEAPPDLEQDIADAAEAAQDADVHGLSELYRLLAENTREDARRPRYRLKSAEWLWAATPAPRREGVPGAPDEAVVARFLAAYSEAALLGDAATKEAAERWLRSAGIPVPEPDLEGDDGGG